MEELILWIAPAIDWLWSLGKWWMLLIIVAVALITILTDTKPKAPSLLDKANTWLDEKTKELERIAESKKEDEDLDTDRDR